MELPRSRAAWTALALLLLPLLLAARQGGTRTASGRLIAADGAPVAGLRVVLRRGGDADSATAAPDGRFTLRLPGGEGALELAVDAPAGSPRRFHPSAAGLRPGEMEDELRVVMVPRRWTVRAGSHAGTRVEISLDRAFSPACPGCSSFFRPGLRDPASGRLAPSPTWPAGAYPLRVAFTGEPEAERVEPGDSAAFWRIAEELEADLGRDLLRPARFVETLTDARGAPEDVVLVESDPRLRRVGWGSTISQAGDIVYGAIRIREPGVIRDRDGPRLVKHELMHALGVGHTCAWRSVMAQVTECGSRASPAPTAEDVAYFEVLTRTRDLQRILGAPLALEAGLRGERAGGPRPAGSRG